MPAVESAHKREYKLRDIARAGLEAVQRALPDGYPRFTRTMRHHAAHSWRDPDGRFHIMAVNPKTGFPTIISFWTDELERMLKNDVLQIDTFRLDPQLRTSDVKRLAPRGRIPEGWLQEAGTR